MNFNFRPYRHLLWCALIPVGILFVISILMSAGDPPQSTPAGPPYEKTVSTPPRMTKNDGSWADVTAPHAKDESGDVTATQVVRLHEDPPVREVAFTLFALLISIGVVVYILRGGKAIYFHEPWRSW